jgi:hypothetical protein
MDKNQDIIDIIKSAPAIQPTASFTDNVMQRLPDRYPDILLAAGSYIYQLYNKALEPDGDRASGLTRRECSFYFFITGFFYLIIGIIMTLGLQGISSGMVAMEWIKLQPHLAIGSALWLLALGGLLMMDGNAGIKAARYGALLYIFFAVVNGILMRIYLHIPFAGVLIIGFVATSALMGVMLAQAVKKVELRLV